MISGKLFQCFFGIKGHVALDRNPGPWFDYPTLAIDSRRSFKCMSVQTVPHTTRPFRQSGCTVKLLP